ncbi:MAG: serpin family protein [Candidatus Limnocylindrales bacterium]|jgi:serpin B
MSEASDLVRVCRTTASIRISALLLAGGFVWSCASPAAAGIGLATSSASRAPGSLQEASTAATDVTAFGLDVYGKIAALEGNLVFSPTSIAIALAMADAGARGETATQMDMVLHIDSGAASGAGFGSLDEALAAVSGRFTDSAGNVQEVSLRIANAPVAQSGMHVEQAYLDTLASRYGAGLRLVDYRNDADGACQLIDDWVRAQTENRIPKLLDQLSPLTRLVLVNAIYLKAPWLEPFSATVTTPADFTRPDGTTVSVPTMRDASNKPYAAGAGWQAVELPYVGGSLAMTIIVPDDMAAFEKSLNAAKFASITNALQPATVDLSMPRFKTETKTDLAALLAGLGMPLAVDPDRADFSGITSDERLYISHVVHQANIEVDENGTAASAATAVEMAVATAAPMKAVTLRVDRPFLFALRDKRTGAILFLGRIVDPAAA